MPRPKQQITRDKNKKSDAFIEKMRKSLAYNQTNDPLLLSCIFMYNRRRNNIHPGMQMQWAHFFIHSEKKKRAHLFTFCKFTSCALDKKMYMKSHFHFLDNKQTIHLRGLWILLKGGQYLAMYTFVCLTQTQVPRILDMLYLVREKLGWRIIHCKEEKT